MWTFSDNLTAALVLMPAGYLAGSIPFGAILGRLRGVDLRKAGSGNVGATNVGRVLGAKWGYLCFLLDMAKGLAASLAATLLLNPGDGAPSAARQAIWVGTGCAAVLGHVFSLFLRFRGGKGVSTALGAVLGIWPYFTVAGLVAGSVWVAVTLASRYVSLGSLTAGAALLAAFLAINWPRLGELWPMAIFAAGIVAIIVVRHRGNIRRLRNGTENKIRRS
jgi:acyl phosphate:glycerol-3-phosphate acyltransferase